MAQDPNTNAATSEVDAETLAAFKEWQGKQATKKVAGGAKRLATAQLIKRHQPEFESMKKFATDNPNAKAIPATVKA